MESTDREAELIEYATREQGSKEEYYSADLFSKEDHAANVIEFNAYEKELKEWSEEKGEVLIRPDEIVNRLREKGKMDAYINGWLIGMIGQIEMVAGGNTVQNVLKANLEFIKSVKEGVL